jgi:uncharacterized membrane protein YdjX (TVP38/TMEM64 family)
MSDNSSPNQDDKGRLPVYLTLGALLIMGIALISSPGLREFFINAWEVLTSGNEKRIEAWVSGFGAYGPLVLIAAMTAQMFLLVVPTILLMFVAILAYGPVWGSLLTLLAVVVASTVGYALGRFLGENTLMRLIGKRTESKLAGYLEDYGFWAVFVTRLNPFLSNDAISFVGGILRMGYLRFIGATVLGICPLILVIAIFNQSSGQWKTALLWSSMAGSFILAGYIWWGQRKKKDTGNA